MDNFIQAVEQVIKEGTIRVVVKSGTEYVLDNDKVDGWIVHMAPVPALNSWMWFVNGDLPEYYRENMHRAIQSRVAILPRPQPPEQPKA